ncbi:HAD family phosphatase [Anaerosacchariphilus sp. NSJ-68]|uniref:HAD family phosphatase n=2 Tax=Lachnospiraceae TaxID=186803 RepID=A0A923L9T1_9FIRM|nr:MULTISPECIES: HAD family hydrolase [Lachnospiraceae]MBC5658581.1 HAD family phosphatase [Anaerosacchariphilus hominis]MBC5698210.1 HAD family phosphatase [Roseburia difficilis]
MKPFFFIDYDNTIFSHRTWAVPDSALEALSHLKELGCRVVLASGRPFRYTSLPEEFQGRFLPDCLVSSNGAIIETPEEVLWEKYFDPELQTRLLDYVVEKKYCLMSSADGKWCTSNLERFLELASPRQRKLLPESGEAFQKIYHCQMTSFFLSDTEEAIADVQAHFPELKLLYMGPELGGADIIPAENGKVIGASRILSHYGLTWEHTVAIGDSMNDIDLIRKASCGIAMGNAMKEVQEAADYVTADIDADGLARAIAHALKLAGLLA